MDNLEKLKLYSIKGGFDKQSDLAGFLDVDPARISEWKKGKPVQDRYIQKLEKEFGIIEKDGDTIKFIRDPDQISTHLAKRVTENAVSKIDPALLESIALGAQNIDSSRFVKVPLKSAYVHAGKGVVNHEVETKGTMMIDKMLFKIIPNLNNISAVEVIGKSMYPTLDEGDFVVIEHNTDFNGEGIYVLSFEDMLLVKRLQASSKGIKILSDNKYYDDDEYDKHDDQRSLFIVGKVILRIQR